MKQNENILEPSTFHVAAQTWTCNIHVTAFKRVKTHRETYYTTLHVTSTHISKKLHKNVINFIL